MITSLSLSGVSENYSPEMKQSISFLDTVGAMNSIAYSPFIDSFRNKQKHGYEVDTSYNSLKDIGNYQQYKRLILIQPLIGCRSFYHFCIH